MRVFYSYHSHEDLEQKLHCFVKTPERMHRKAWIAAGLFCIFYETVQFRLLEHVDKSKLFIVIPTATNKKIIQRGTGNELAEELK